MMTNRVFLLIAFIITLFFVYFMLKNSGFLIIIMDTERLIAWINELNYWGPGGIMVLMAIAVIINPIPSAPIALVAGAIYGHTWGTVYVVIGAGSGALAAFWIARLLGYELLRRLLGERIDLGWLGSQNFLTGMVFISRLLPFISFDLVSYGAGLTVIKFWRFAIATLTGLIPASFLLAHFGGELTSSSLEQTISILLMLGFITIIPIVIKVFLRWYKNIQSSHNS
ncbi:MAG: VTT domain-containing protein [Gammaproteobacteria bacterium]|nr:VTT domain-containing protein [Gammaproteobacteria bacterium]